MSVQTSNIIKTITNAVLVAILVTVNITYQTFCRPVWWAEVIAVTCLLWTVIRPLVRDKVHPLLNSFLSATTCLFWSYICFFILTENLFHMSVISLLAGLVFLLVFNFFEWKKKSMEGTGARLLFGVVIAFAVSVAFVSAKTYHRTAQEIAAAGVGRMDSVQEGYWVERITGMHFIYHTRYCIFDGWRPPRLDPLLTVALAANHYEDPLRELGVTLEERLQLYRKRYPDRPYKFKCPCAIHYGDMYHEDPLWNTSAPEKTNN